MGDWDGPTVFEDGTGSGVAGWDRRTVIGLDCTGGAGLVESHLPLTAGGGKVEQSTSSDGEAVVRGGAVEDRIDGKEPAPLMVSTRVGSPWQTSYKEM